MRNCSFVLNNSLFDRKDNQNSHAAASFPDIFYPQRSFSPIPRRKNRTTNDLKVVKVLKDFKDLKSPLPEKRLRPATNLVAGRNT